MKNSAERSPAPRALTVDAKLTGSWRWLSACGRQRRLRQEGQTSTLTAAVFQARDVLFGSLRHAKYE